MNKTALIGMPNNKMPVTGILKNRTAPPPHESTTRHTKKNSDLDTFTFRPKQKFMKLLDHHLRVHPNYQKKAQPSTLSSSSSTSPAAVSLDEDKEIVDHVVVSHSKSETTHEHQIQLIMNRLNELELQLDKKTSTPPSVLMYEEQCSPVQITSTLKEEWKYDQVPPPTPPPPTPPPPALPPLAYHKVPTPPPPITTTEALKTTGKHFKLVEELYCPSCDQVVTMDDTKEEEVKKEAKSRSSRKKYRKATFERKKKTATKAASFSSSSSPLPHANFLELPSHVRPPSNASSPNLYPVYPPDSPNSLGPYPTERRQMVRQRLSPPLPPSAYLNNDFPPSECSSSSDRSYTTVSQLVIQTPQKSSRRAIMCCH